MRLISNNAEEKKKKHGIFLSLEPVLCNEDFYELDILSPLKKKKNEEGTSL